MSHNCEEAQTTILRNLLEVHETKTAVALIEKDIHLINSRLDQQQKEIKELRNSIPLLQDSVEEVLDEIRSISKIPKKEEENTKNNSDLKQQLFKVVGTVSTVVLSALALMALGVKSETIELLVKIALPFL
jgi:chromosome segregation ATPase